MPEHALILAPRGRDAVLAATMLADAGMTSEIVASYDALIDRLNDDAGFVIITEEAIRDVDPAPLHRWRLAQPEWSDLPFILLTERGGVERNPAAARYIDLFGNITFVERPFHPMTFVSLAKAARRGRRKQYDTRAHLEAVHRSDQRFRAAINAVQGVLWTNSADGRMEGEQPAWSRLTGQSADAYQGFGWADAVHPDDAPGTVKAWNEAVAEQRLFAFEHRVRRYDGEWRMFSIRAMPTFTTDGTLREWVGVHTDVTDARLAEAALRDLNLTLEQRVTAAIAERKILADIFESTDSFVQVIDADFRWLAINRAAADEFERVFGHRPVVGESQLEVLAGLPTVSATIRAIWQRALDGEDFTHLEKLGDPTRDQRTYEMKFNALRDSTGKQIGAFQIASDVSQRIDDVAHLAETQEALRQAQKMEAIGQLTGGVAHDFNNLLTVIRGGAEFLRKPDLSPDRQQRYVEAIYEAADRAAKLTQQLLAFSRRQPLRPSVFDVAERVITTTEMLRSIVGGRITMDVQCDPDLRVNADIAQFDTALVNLCVNARDAMNGEGRLAIRAFKDGNNVCVAVEDEGEGIDPDILPRLFEPFFTTKAVGKGTGLGLSQVYGFARQSGGDVQVSSKVDIGTVFTLLLPATRAPMASDDRSNQQATGRSCRILVVEDNDELRSFASTLLSELGHVVDAAASADDALAVLADDAADFEVVFTDVVMPGMSGLELARRVRDTWPSINVILASGYSDALANAEGLEFPLVSKPYSGAQLAALL